MEPGSVSLRQGEVFHGRYRVERCIAAGAMGAVYEVTDDKTNSRRALKVMLPSLVEDADSRARFALEAKVTGNIESDHIIRVSDAGVDDGTKAPFLVMDLLRGQELGKMVETRKQVPPGEVVTYLTQAALALDKTHAAGIVHRDLKPENLFVTTRDDGSPCVKILDFGIAKVVAGSDQSKKTKALGTPLYMSPEQVKGGHAIGPKADIYALGQVAYTLLAGEAYWTEESLADDSLYHMLIKIVEGVREPPNARSGRRKGVQLPPAFDAWFMRATAANPDQRFDRATVAITALGEALRSGPVPVQPANPAMATMGVGPTQPANPAMATMGVGPTQPANPSMATQGVGPGGPFGQAAPLPFAPAAPQGVAQVAPAPMGQMVHPGMMAPPPSMAMPVAQKSKSPLTGILIAAFALLVVGLGVTGLWAAGVFGSGSSPPPRGATSPSAAGSSASTGRLQPYGADSFSTATKVADPSHADPLEIFPWVRGLVLEVDKSAKLTAIIASGTSHGTLALSDTDIFAYHFVTATGKISVTVNKERIVISTRSTWDYKDPLPDPGCSSKTAWRAVVGAGMPDAATAHLYYKQEPRRGAVLYFQSADGNKTVDLNPVTCAVSRK